MNSLYNFWNETNKLPLKYAIELSFFDKVKMGKGWNISLRDKTIIGIELVNFNNSYKKGFKHFINKLNKIITNELICSMCAKVVDFDDIEKAYTRIPICEYFKNIYNGRKCCCSYITDKLLSE